MAQHGVNPILPLDEYIPDGGTIISNGDVGYQGLKPEDRTNGHMPHCTNTILQDGIPYITHGDGGRYITGIKDGTRIGYKYLAFTGATKLTLRTRGSGTGSFAVATGEGVIAQIAVSPADTWSETSATFSLEGAAALYLDYHGEGTVELLSLAFESQI